MLWASWSYRKTSRDGFGDDVSRSVLGLFTVSLWKVPRAALLAWHLCGLCQ